MLSSHIPRPSFTVVGFTLAPQQLPGCFQVEMGKAHPSRYCTIRPFLDHDIHLGSAELESDRFSTRMTLGDSFPGGFATLQTLKSPLEA